METAVFGLSSRFSYLIRFEFSAVAFLYLAYKCKTIQILCFVFAFPSIFFKTNQKLYFYTGFNPLQLIIMRFRHKPLRS